MIVIKNKAKCCGCGTCQTACPVNAINMEEDNIGFVFPRINASKCVNCGLCERVCPVLNHKNEENFEHSFYVAYARDREVRLNGSSGGMFGLLAESIISGGGHVYGAAFDGEMRLKCTCATKIEELKPLYKSKYLQSDLGFVFEEIKQKLDASKRILFVATPCQVYALKLFLKKDYPNLLTVDFVCHGVPSQSFFDKCKEYVEKRDKIKIIDFEFRSKKKNGSTPHYYTQTYIRNGKTKVDTRLYLDSPFYLGFQKYITLRDSCYDCQFSYSNRVSDITIGDFHEVDKYVSGINRFDGVSSLVVNTQKGRDAWKQIAGKAVFEELDFEMLVKNGELMCGGTVKPKSRAVFVCDLKNMPFEKLVQKYFNPQKQLSKRLYYSLPKFARRILKKVLVK